jgi:hypothetical protein
MLFISLIVALGAAQAGPAVSENPRFLDTQVGPVHLRDDVSGKAFVVRFGGKESEPDLGLPVFRYLNAGRTEVLDLVMHPGGLRYEFMQVRIRRARRSEPNTTPVDYDSFQSGRGVHLGLSIPEVIRLLGAPQEEKAEGSERTLVYRCTSSAVCPILTEVNMPEYQGRYFFLDGTLVRCEWGYPYP